MTSRRMYMPVGVLLVGLALGCVVTYTAMNHWQAGAVLQRPAANDSDSGNPKMPMVELKAKPSSVATDFDFMGLAHIVADPAIRAGSSVNVDSGGGGASYDPGRTERRHTAVWLCKGSGHEAAVRGSVIKEVE